jgi:hypothetical protein
MHLLLAFLVAISFAVEAHASPQEWGLHNIWGDVNADRIPEVKGGYVTANWADVNPSPGTFDFSVFDEELSRYRELGKRATVAIRGRQKPDYLFREVPYHPEQLAIGVKDEQGTLQYWHPTYKKRYQELLSAFANYLRTSVNRDVVYSVRQNVNALGTEHSEIDESKQSRDQWIVPAGVDFVPYSKDADTSFKTFSSQTYYDMFANDFLLLIRTNNLSDLTPNVPAVVMRAIENGSVGLLHTTSQAEPLAVSTERQYDVHVKYGKNGSTPIYAEPYARSESSTNRNQSPVQWNYWRVLSDLHSGVSYISVYGVDLEKRSNAEYNAAFALANKYAGHQVGRAAATAPGAWVAMRQGNKWLTGDYTYLMKRMSGDSNTPLTGVGPDWQRFGAWARRIGAGGQMRFQLDDRIAPAMSNAELKLRVTYLNANSPQFDVQLGRGPVNSYSGGTSGTWRTAEFTLSSGDLASNSGADITLRSQSGVTVHMVELVHGNDSDVPQPVVRPNPPSLNAE